MDYTDACTLLGMTEGGCPCALYKSPYDAGECTTTITLLPEISGPCAMPAEMQISLVEFSTLDFGSDTEKRDKKPKSAAQTPPKKNTGRKKVEIYTRTKSPIELPAHLENMDNPPPLDLNKRFPMFAGNSLHPVPAEWKELRRKRKLLPGDMFRDIRMLQEARIREETSKSVRRMWHPPWSEL
ncbi:hypothetical protein K470DRAFT_258776 [Piedraia hortae CBS 480.64]|uniref:Uncharacterized protein n=1 Tax=Piedraia hortae CBS 480.64 TaxID=1314780 RepID=A0A6A7BYI9_9PEZI|nr:hypothetical protein K470DRAFT_258776 [Piedraia hortae CBS 480.64]